MTVGITVTGIDERTNAQAVFDLVELGAEVGILYTHSPDGRNRYPSKEWIAKALGVLPRRQMALHVCGSRARTDLLRGDLDGLIKRVGRIQANGKLTQSEVMSICSSYPHRTIITQYPASPMLWLGTTNHALLVDSSGGSGKSPESWERPVTGKEVGFAGGLGPDNLAEQLPRISAVATGNWWVDMEGKLRDADDWFDAGKALAAVEIFNTWKGANSGHD